MGLETTLYLVNRTKDRVNRYGTKKAREARDMLKAEMVIDTVLVDTGAMTLVLEPGRRQ